MGENKKTLIFSIIGVVLFILVIIGTSYAYFTANVETENDDNSGINDTTANISAKFENGSLLNITDLVPGDKVSKDVTITNTGTVDLTVKIGIKDVVNQFADLDKTNGDENHKAADDIVYTITEKTSSSSITSASAKSFPAVAGPISDTISLPAGEAKTYTIEIEFKNVPDYDQEKEMGKSVGGKLYIENTSEE